MAPAYGFKSTDLSPELIPIRDEIREHAQRFGLDCFDVIFEMIDHEQMNAFAAYGGFPVRYPHWRFGMDYDQLSKSYEWGLQKIYEMVINTNPSYAYLMRANSLVDQKTVMAHVYGHVDFFKNNYWFSQTNRKMLDTIANHAIRVRNLMDEHGQDKIESFIDKLLALEPLIDPYLPFSKPSTSSGMSSTGTEKEDSFSGEVGKLKSDRSYMDRYINPPEFIREQEAIQRQRSQQQAKFPPSPQKDVLLFLLEHAPLKEWEQFLVKMIRDEAQYFAPQGMTKIMNEGWASYWHSKIMTEKVLKASEIIDFCDHHAGTLASAPGRLNPYKIGIELFRDIEERWNRGQFGKEYEECTDLRERHRWNRHLNLGRQKIFEVRQVCNDVTFIDQYLTPEFVDRFKLYHYEFNKRTGQYEIVNRDFKEIKEKLLSQLSNRGQPLISVVDGNFENRGELLLLHQHLGQDLEIRYTEETLKALSSVWKRSCHLQTLVEGQTKIFSYTLNAHGQGEFSDRVL